MITKKIIISLLVIILLAFFLRFYQVTEIPPSLNWDEVSIGYNAYSILKTGHDEWGQFMPLNFKSYGEYKLPVQIYASIPGIYFFGLNELGVRITPVVYGTLTVLLTFFLAQIIFKNYLIALTSSFLLAISPWHIQLTRVSFEASFSVFWIVLGLYFFIKGLEKPKWWFVSPVSFILAIYTYNSARMFVPMFLVVLVLVFKKNVITHFKRALFSGIIFMILLIPLTGFILSGQASARYKLVSITDDPGLVPRIELNRVHSNLPGLLPQLIHNRITYISFYFGQNYLAHFTPQFLFTSGAPHKQHHVQGMGELYLFEAPFLFLGLFYLYKQRNSFRWVLTSWILLAYIPVSVTHDSIPHALRTVIVLPFYQLISALGFYQASLLYKKRFKNILPGLAVLTIIITLSVGYYLYRYHLIYPVAYSRDWQYGYKQVADFINKKKSDYDLIVFTRHYGEPHMFTLFFSQYDPRSFFSNPYLLRFETANWIRVLNFDKYYFPDLGDSGTKYQDIVSQNKDRKLLFIGKSSDFPKDKQKLFRVNFLNGKNAFEIVESI